MVQGGRAGDTKDGGDAAARVHAGGLGNQGGGAEGEREGGGGREGGGAGREGGGKGVGRGGGGGGRERRGRGNGIGGKGWGGVLVHWRGFGRMIKLHESVNPSHTAKDNPITPTAWESCRKVVGKFS